MLSFFIGKEGDRISTLKYSDLDDILHDTIELFEKAEKRCNELKKDTESERSIWYQLLEDYFYDVSEFMKEKNKYIVSNLNNIPDLKLRDDNIFNSILTKR